MKQLSIYETDYLESLSTLNNTTLVKSNDTQHFAPAIPFQTKENDALNSDEPSTHQANVTEIIIAKNKADSIQLLLPMLTNLNQEKRWLAWIDPPIQLLKQWRESHNELAMEEIMILRSSETNSAFDLSKKALEAGTCHAVIAWTCIHSQEEFSQLEHASSKGNSHGIILRTR
jgi:cell division inhibitor SulA